jgi:hypothetical protein
MKSRHSLRVSVLACALLVVPVSCDGGGSSRQPVDLGQGAAVPAETSTPSETAPRPEPVEPMQCRSEPRRSWTVHDIATRNLIPYGTLADVVVSRSGTATVAWYGPAGDGYAIHTTDQPAAPGDPQSPAGPFDPNRESLFNAFGGEDVLGIDAAGAQTLVWLADERGPSAGPGLFTENYDIVRGDRSPGGEWSNSTLVVGAGFTTSAQLAVNASGAAVVTWPQYTGAKSRGYAFYRDAAGAEWTQMELPKNSSSREAGIDDVGRVLLLFTRGNNERTRTYAVRRTPAGGWADPQRLAGGNLDSDLAVGADGSAVVVRDHVSYDADTPRGSQITLRMTPSGRWQPPVLQPALTETVVGSSVDIDAKGRALLAWWDGTDLLVRWSRPDGEWRRPCVLAAGVKRPLSVDPNAQLAVNRRGDALVVWGAKGRVVPRVAQLWARYRPAGRGWTKPVKLTRADSPPGSFTVALGDRGHAAIAWTTRNDRQIQILRTFPTPRP